MKKTALKITGMNCASCVAHIQNDLYKLPGVKEAAVNFATEKGEVTYDETALTDDDLIRRIKKTGYTASVIGAPAGSGATEHAHHHPAAEGNRGEDHAAHARAEEGAPENRARMTKLAVAGIASAAVVVLAFAADIPKEMEIMLALTLTVLAYSGREFFIRGIPSLLRGRPGMDTLVALGVGAAFLYSAWITLFTEKHEEYFVDAAVITTFILLGRYLEARAKGSAGAAIKKLLQLSAKVAHRVQPGGGTEDVPIEQVQPGDLLRVKPGEKVPVDGAVTEGSATLDESMVTGESIPVDKKTGDKIIGATLNGNTAFTMRAEGVGASTMLARIIKMVQDAQMTKAPIQKLADAVAGYFTWGVMAVAAATFLFWTFGAQVEISRAIIYTVAVLIIACPCALGLATPIAIVVGSGRGAEMGILIKKAEALEKVHRATIIAFDKTGTITKGLPEVQEFEPLAENVLDLALSLESHSEHPLAKSVVNFAKEKGAAEMTVKNFKALTGLGVTGEIGKTVYHLGSSRYMEQLAALAAVKEKVATMQEKGYTVLILADDKKALALFGVQDGVKASSKTAISRLKKRGIRTVMITGDNEKVARHIAAEVGIDEVHAGVTPEQKTDLVAGWQSQGQSVAMVGDGINDSPALARADVGIAMGTGTDIAMETGDLVLLKGDLLKAVTAMELSEATLRNIKQNLFWAFGYNTVGIPLAALGLLTPAFSAAAMALSSISVVLNALRLRRFKTVAEKTEML